MATPVLILQLIVLLGLFQPLLPALIRLQARTSCQHSSGPSLELGTDIFRLNQRACSCDVGRFKNHLK